MGLGERYNWSKDWKITVVWKDILGLHNEATEYYDEEPDLDNVRMLWYDVLADRPKAEFVFYYIEEIETTLLAEGNSLEEE